MMDNARVAPVRGVPVAAKPWEGCLARKPWEYPATLAVVHRDTPEMLEGVVALFRAQRARPYVLVVDTGSGPASAPTLEALDAADDCEVHYLRGKGWRGSSCPVAAAMDLAFAACQTEYLFSTHTDVYPTSPDLVGDVVGRCDARTPVVGWQMSPRDGWPDASWSRTPSHTATAYHMPTMRRIGAQWSLLGAMDRLGMPHGQTTGGYPDTETCLGLVLAEHGYTPRWWHQPDDGMRHVLFLGKEPNEPYETEWFRHVRTAGSVLIYYPNELIAALRSAQVAAELAAIPERLARWSADLP